MSILSVNLGENSYEIIIDAGILSTLGDRCAQLGLKGTAAIITNQTVFALYGETVKLALEVSGFKTVCIEVPDGEKYKNSTTLNNIYDALATAGIDRSSFVVALGGGVVGDMAGYAAATWLRGIPFVQVPTTLLAQVDSSVGGKTGIDHPSGKNLIGAFYQPQLVLIDILTLQTLDARQFKAGLAEVIKYGVAIDASFFDFIDSNLIQILNQERSAVVEVIRRCCELKSQIVEMDEKESGLRAILNYGHTFGHAFETIFGFEAMVHGEAVAIGMILAAKVSAACNYCNQGDVNRIASLLERCGLSIQIPSYDRDKLLDAIASDKKSRGGEITFICNQGVGMYALAKHSSEELLKLSGLEV